MEMIKCLYGQDYHLFPLQVEPGDQGHTAVARPRLYVICAHKARTRRLLNVEKAYSMVTRAIKRRVETRVRDYMIAERWEVLLSAQRVAAKRHQEFRPVPRLCRWIVRRGFLLV